MEYYKDEMKMLLSQKNYIKGCAEKYAVRIQKSWYSYGNKFKTRTQTESIDKQLKHI